jgi:hypothetical protein
VFSAVLFLYLRLTEMMADKPQQPMLNAVSHQQISTSSAGRRISINK